MMITVVAKKIQIIRVLSNTWPCFFPRISLSFGMKWEFYFELCTRIRHRTNKYIFNKEYNNAPRTVKGCVDLTIL